MALRELIAVSSRIESGSIISRNLEANILGPALDS
jgi:hypothetical protein